MRRYPKYLFSDNKKRNFIYSIIVLLLATLSFYLTTESMWHLLTHGEKVTATILTKEQTTPVGYVVDYTAAYEIGGVQEIIEFDVRRAYRPFRPSHSVGEEIEIIIDAEHPNKQYWTKSLFVDFVVLGLLVSGVIGLLYYIFLRKRKEILFW